MVNKVLLECRLVFDPESYILHSGVKKVSMRVASNRVFRNSSGEKVEKTLFIDVECWGNLAETCEKFLSKGRRVLVEGRLDLDSWTSKDGKSAQKVYITADNIHFLDRGNAVAVNNEVNEEEEVPF